MEVVNYIALFVRDTSWSNSLYPFLLVNRHWYRCTIGSTYLFNRVAICTDMTVPAISGLLSLSRSALLKIQYVILEASKPIGHDPDLVASLIAQHSHRIRALTIKCDLPELTTTVFQHFSAVEWPVLRRVFINDLSQDEDDLSQDEEDDYPVTTWDIDAFCEWLDRSSATLSHLRICGGLANSQLRSVENQVAFPQLRKFKYWGPQFPHGWDVFHDAPGLHTLIFESLDYDVVAPVIHMLSLHPHPSLTYLAIHSRPRDRWADVTPPSFWVMLAKSSPSLTRLTLPHGDKELLVTLARDATLWPRLIRIYFFHTVQSVYDVIHLLQSRGSSPTPLESVGVDGEYWLSPL
jgi:hypothetical protein